MFFGMFSFEMAEQVCGISSGSPKVALTMQIIFDCSDLSVRLVETQPFPHNGSRAFFCRNMCSASGKTMCVCRRRVSGNTPLLDPRLVSIRGVVVGVALHKHLKYGTHKCAECIHTEECFEIAAYG